MIPFNRPQVFVQTVEFIEDCLHSGHTLVNGNSTKRREVLFRSRYGGSKTLMMTSRADALEMSGLLFDIEPGEDDILSSSTFVLNAKAFALCEATLSLVDSLPYNPNLDLTPIDPLLKDRSRIIVAVHCAGVACDMDSILNLAEPPGIFIVEDVEQTLEATYKGRFLSKQGQTGTFSSHESNNLPCCEGELLLVNSENLSSRGEFTRNKGTNRSVFFDGEVDKYGWVEVVYSFLLSDNLAAMLWALLIEIDYIQAGRLTLWNRYQSGLEDLEIGGFVTLFFIPPYAGHNAHCHYLVLLNLITRNSLFALRKAKGIMAIFDYQSLHNSPYFRHCHNGCALPQTDSYSDCLVGSPLFHDLAVGDQRCFIDQIPAFFGFKNYSVAL